jgi:hypothetical protein
MHEKRSISAGYCLALPLAGWLATAHASLAGCVPWSLSLISFQLRFAFSFSFTSPSSILAWHPQPSSTPTHFSPLFSSPLGSGGRLRPNCGARVLCVVYWLVTDLLYFNCLKV